MDANGVLLLEDGSLWTGSLLGAQAVGAGELCFNTSMSGYQETYTDPSYYQQIIIHTTAHVGNYGIHAREEESPKVHISGVVMGAYSASYSRHQATESLGAYLHRHGVSGLYGVDTRALVRHLIRTGAMNGLIASATADKKALEQHLSAVPQMAGRELSSQVSTRHSYTLGEGKHVRVAVLDLGIKGSILQHLVARGLCCRVFPSHSTFKEMESWTPHGYFVSNGPGDPAGMDAVVKTIKAIIGAGKPFFGICLGHQLLARAYGVQTYKLKFGHRGVNHSVKNLATGRCEVSSQNHGFSVDKASLARQKDLVLTHINLNDNTVAGLRARHTPAFSVQYHPEAAPGPHDSTYLFDDFKDMLSSSA